MENKLEDILHSKCIQINQHGGIKVEIVKKTICGREGDYVFISQYPYKEDGISFLAEKFICALIQETCSSDEDYDKLKSGEYCVYGFIAKKDDRYPIRK